MKYKIKDFLQDRLFERNSEAAYHANQMMLKAVSLAGMVGMAVLAVASLCVERRMGLGSWFCHALVAMLVFAVMYAAAVFLKGKMVYWTGYLLYFAFVAFCIYTSAFLWPDDICIMMSAGLFVFPAFYLDKSWRVTGMTVLSSLLYVWVISIYKEPFCLHNELVSVLCFTVIGCITGAAVRKTKLENIEHGEEQRQNAQKDGMTGAYNRKTLETLVNQRLSYGFGGDCALLLIDIDNLKQINDTLGHPQGDAAIRGIVETLRGALRQTDLIGRIGGDEFIAFLGECGDEARVAEVAGRLTREIAKGKVGEHGDYQVTVSMGITLRKPTDHTFDDLYHRADTALYKAKNGGKNRCAFG